MFRSVSLGKALVALVGILSVALVAASLRTPIEASTSGGSGLGGGGGAVQPTTSFGIGEAPLFLEILFVLGVAFVAVLGAIYVVTHPGEMLIRLVGTVALALLMVGVVVAVTHLVGSGAESVPTEPGQSNGGSGDPGVDGDGNGTIPGQILYGAVLIVTFFAVFVASLLYTRSAISSDEDDAPETPEPDVSGDTPVDLADAAGRAADRIGTAEGADLENEVYRAWFEMTQLLDVERPETSTPGEFADAATAAGLRDEHVRSLTNLFESVRYGPTETTPELEERAVETLQRIESVYGGSDATEVTSA